MFCDRKILEEEIVSKNDSLMRKLSRISDFLVRKTKKETVTEIGE
jgi:hypothetical protein